MTTPSLFDFSNANTLSSSETEEAVRKFGNSMNRSKSDSTVTDFKPVATAVNHTGQAFTSVNAVVVAATDKKIGEHNTPVLQLGVLVRQVCDDSQDPVFDLVNQTYQIPTIKIQGEEKKQYPRYIGPGDVRMIPIRAFVDVQIRKSSNPKDVFLSASDVPHGTHVKITGIMATSKSHNVYMNAKSVIVIKEVEDRFSGFDALQDCFCNAHTSTLHAMIASSLLGGINNMISQAQYMGSILYKKLEDHRVETADALCELASRLDGKVVGEGETWATSILKQPSDVLELAETIRSGELAVTTITNNGPTVPLPLLFEARKPWEVNPPSMQNLLVSSSDSDFTVAADITLVEVSGYLAKIYFNVAIGLNGASGRDAIAHSQSPILRADGPVGLIRRSMKDLAVDFDTRSIVKATMATKEILPHARIISVVPARFREWGDRAFSDGDWATRFVVDVASGIRMAGLPVSLDFCREYADGDVVISEHVPDAKDVVPVSTGPDAPAVVRLKFSGYSALTETNSNLNRLDGPRLPSTCKSVSFFVVFEGGAQLLCKDPELASDINKSEAAVRAWANSNVSSNYPLEQVLVNKTLLYAVADKSDGESPGENVKKQKVH